MTDIVETVALAIWQARMGTKDGAEIFDKLAARDEWLECARAAIEAYEKHLRMIGEEAVKITGQTGFALRAFPAPKSSQKRTWQNLTSSQGS